MKEHTNKDLEKFVEKVMKSSKLESPSFEFTAKVMSQVTKISNSAISVYRPLISKTTWGILLLLTFGIVIFSVFSKDTNTLGWFDTFDLSKIPNLFSGIQVSRTVMYSLVMFAVMLFIQVPMLKHYFNKRFET